MNFEELLEQAIQRVTPSRTRDAMEYSLMSGGKRLRPMFLYDTLAGYGLNPERGNEFAIALELSLEEMSRMGLEYREDITISCYPLEQSEY